MLNRQDQTVEADATAIQAGGNISITHIGPSYSEVREIALSVFKDNYYQLASQAAATAAERAKQITDDFLKKLKEEFPEGLTKAHEPDFQYALFTVQSEYARHGDKALGELLVNLLLDRSKQEQRTILQIVLNESLVTAPKITDDQLTKITIVFLMKLAIFVAPNIASFAQYLKTYLAPFICNLSEENTWGKHLEYAGCGKFESITIGTSSLEGIIGKRYRELFMKGFDAEEISTCGFSADVAACIFVRCMDDPRKLRVNCLEKGEVGPLIKPFKLNNIQQKKIRELFDLGLMSDNEIRGILSQPGTPLDNLFQIWSKKLSMGSFTLTSVGIALAHANVKRLGQPVADLSVWIK